MGRSRPRIYTPRVMECVKGLLGDGKTVEEIAELMGVPVDQVRSACGRLHVSVRCKGARIGFVVPPTLSVELEKEALARGVSASKLCQRIVEAVIQDGMFAAVLDE